MASRDWPLAALLSDDADVAAHALLRLWQRVHRATQQPATRTALGHEFAALPPRVWRRLALLLFAEDAFAVKAVVSIAMALAVPQEGAGRCAAADAGNDTWRRPVQQRIWQSDWRAFILDKLTDCHARATAVGTPRGDADAALRFLVVLRAVFLEALRGGLATPKDQGRTIDAVVELALSPVDPIACLALQLLHELLSDTAAPQRLDSDVRAYLDASRVYADLLEWLDAALLASIEHTKAPPGVASARGRRHRLCLTFDLLVHAARSSAEVARTIARHKSEQLVELVLRVAECDRFAVQLGQDDANKLRARALELLSVVLRHDIPVAAELASTIRLGGALISVAWLLGHTARAVRAAAYDMFAAVERLSASRDLVRAVVEQGCVFVCFTLLFSEQNDGENAENLGEKAPCRALLKWVLSVVESQEEAFVQQLATSARRSTNPKLQRNVLLSLLLLSHASGTVHEALFVETDGGAQSLLTEIVDDAIHASGDDARFASALIAVALLGSDTQSTLKREPATSASSRVLITEPSSELPLSPPSRQVTLRCEHDERVVVDAALLVSHCKLFARTVPLLPATSSMTFDLQSHNAGTVELLVRLLSMSPLLAARELQRGSVDAALVAQLLRLAKAIESTKCWHAASLAISNSLGSDGGGSRWRAALELAVELRHPALQVRALRAALVAPTRNAPSARGSDPTSAETAAERDLQDAALVVWRQILAARLLVTYTGK